MMLPRCSPGGLFLFCNLCWRFTRQLIPRFLVVRIVVDPVKQLLTAWLLVLGPWGFWFRPFRVERHIVESNGQWGVTPLLRLSGSITSRLAESGRHSLRFDPGDFYQFGICPNLFSEKALEFSRGASNGAQAECRIFFPVSANDGSRDQHRVFTRRTRACIQLRRIVTAANCTPARKFLASLS
jgi:hypothetical protein